MAPEVNQRWRDGIDPWVIWHVTDVHNGTVRLAMSRADDEAPLAVREWPENRWAAFVDMQKLALLEPE